MKLACSIAGALSLGMLPALAAGAPAGAAPVVVQQNSPRNTVSAIEARSSVVSIARSRTVTQGSSTVTEIVAIGPDPAPLVLSQSGQSNRAVTFQQGRDPKVSLRQTGGIDRAATIQREIP